MIVIGGLLQLEPVILSQLPKKEAVDAARHRSHEKPNTNDDDDSGDDTQPPALVANGHSSQEPQPTAPVGYHCDQRRAERMNIEGRRWDNFSGEG